MPRAGMARPDYVIRKFGGEERAKRLYASITDLGRREGVAFAFERIRRTPSSVDAHRLVRFASRHGRADAMVEALFSVHFTEGYDIGDQGVLVAIATACGLDAAAAKAFLASDEEADAVHADNLRAHRLGINGVPCFVIGGRHAIAGAQEPEVIERLLDVAAVDACARAVTVSIACSRQVSSPNAAPARGNPPPAVSSAATPDPIVLPATPRRRRADG